MRVAAVAGTQRSPAPWRIGLCAAFKLCLNRVLISRIEELTRCLSTRMSGDSELSSLPSKSSASATKSLRVLNESVTAKFADE
jgi:hypothetical protein